MSMTFAPTGLGGTYVAHECDDICTDYLPADGICPGDWVEPGVNMSNANAREVLVRLGIEPDDSGEIDPADLRARIALAAVLTDRVEVPTLRVGNVVDCGRDADYLHRKFAALDEVAQQAISLGVTITWA